MGEWAVKAVYEFTYPGQRQERFTGFTVVQLAHSMEILLRNRASQGVRDYTYGTKQAAEECARTANPLTVANTRYRERIYVKCSP